MNYLFLSPDCLHCQIISNILNSKDKEKWTRCLSIVSVEFNNNGILKVFIDGKETGESPVSRVPALYLADKEYLVVGGDQVFEELSNVNWFC